eukprot:gene4352-5516_t
MLIQTNLLLKLYALYQRAVDDTEDARVSLGKQKLYKMKGMRWDTGPLLIEFEDDRYNVPLNYFLSQGATFQQSNDIIALINVVGESVGVAVATGVASRSTASEFNGHGCVSGQGDEKRVRKRAYANIPIVHASVAKDEWFRMTDVVVEREVGTTLEPRDSQGDEETMKLSLNTLQIQSYSAAHSSAFAGFPSTPNPLPPDHPFLNQPPALVWLTLLQSISGSMPPPRLRNSKYVEMAAEMKTMSWDVYFLPPPSPSPPSSPTDTEVQTSSQQDVPSTPASPSSTSSSWSTRPTSRQGSVERNRRGDSRPRENSSTSGLTDVGRDRSFSSFDDTVESPPLSSPSGSFVPLGGTPNPLLHRVTIRGTDCAMKRVAFVLGNRVVSKPVEIFVGTDRLAPAANSRQTDPPRQTISIADLRIDASSPLSDSRAVRGGQEVHSCGGKKDVCCPLSSIFHIVNMEMLMMGRAGASGREPLEPKQLRADRFAALQPTCIVAGGDEKGGRVFDVGGGGVGSGSGPTGKETEGAGAVTLFDFLSPEAHWTEDTIRMSIPEMTGDVGTTEALAVHLGMRSVRLFNLMLTALRQNAAALNSNAAVGIDKRPAKGLNISLKRVQVGLVLAYYALDNRTTTQDAASPVQHIEENVDRDRPSTCLLTLQDFNHSSHKNRGDHHHETYFGWSSLSMALGPD